MLQDGLDDNGDGRLGDDSDSGSGNGDGLLLGLSHMHCHYLVEAHQWVGGEWRSILGSCKREKNFRVYYND